MSWSPPLDVRDRYASNAAQVCALSGTHQQVSVGAASTASNAVAAATNIVRLVADVACRIAIGAAPTATATGIYLPANTVEYIAVAGSQKIAVIQESASGFLSITECA